MTIKAIFFDTNTLLDHGRSAEARAICLLPGAGDALRMLCDHDYRFFIVTNQEGIARGACPPAAIERVHRRIADLFFREHVELEDFLYCPHHPAGTIKKYAFICDCRKPQPGLLLQAARDHAIDLAASWVIGDVLHDIEAGSRAGCRTLLVDNGNETAWRLGRHRVPGRIVEQVHEAAAAIAMANQETV